MQISRFPPRKRLVAQKHRAISRQEKMASPSPPRRVVLGLPSPCPRVCTDGRTGVRWRYNQMVFRWDASEGSAINVCQSGIVINFDNSEQNKPLANRGSNFCARDAIAKHRP